MKIHELELHLHLLGWKGRQAPNTDRKLYNHERSGGEEWISMDLYQDGIGRVRIKPMRRVDNKLSYQEIFDLLQKNFI